MSKVGFCLTYLNPLIKYLFYAFTQAVESENQELELDLSNLGTFNTMFAALFRYVMCFQYQSLYFIYYLLIYMTLTVIDLCFLGVLVNLEYILRQPYRQLFWRRLLMVMLKFYHFDWGSLFLKRLIIFSITLVCATMFLLFNGLMPLC